MCDAAGRSRAALGLPTDGKPCLELSDAKGNGRAAISCTEIVDKTLKTAQSALVEGSILVAIVLFLFLGEVRSAIVVIVTLPLAMRLINRLRIVAQLRRRQESWERVECSPQGVPRSGLS